MNVIPADIVLVTPVWNDARRLAAFGPQLASALAAAGLPVHWVIADDGSDATDGARLAELVNALRQTYRWVTLFPLPSHVGKGGVIRCAWEAHPDAAWLGFLDADGSVSADDWLNLLRRALDAGCSVIGVRDASVCAVVHGSPLRRALHRSFIRLSRVILCLQSADPQCGAKILRAHDYQHAAPWLREAGFAFDAELLITLQTLGIRWLEIPVRWLEVPNGKLSPWQHTLAMFIALLRTRLRMAKLSR